MDAVVKLFCVHTKPNFSQPWNKMKPYSSTTTAFAIDGQRLLTCAHCVHYQTQMKVQRQGSDAKYLAAPLAICFDSNLALLTVPEAEFWEGLDPLPIGPLPTLQEVVTVRGYPIGGDTLSITSGVVSRIEVAQGTYASASLLRVQIDAAINAGNAGGPALNTNGECIGVASDSLRDSSSIGYLIPSPVITHFLTDFERSQSSSQPSADNDGQTPSNGPPPVNAGKALVGFPALGAAAQDMESPHLRAALKLPANRKGLLLRLLIPCSPLAAVARPGDVLLSFDQVNVAADGTVPFHSGQRISYLHLVAAKHVGDPVTITLLRDGKELTFTINLTASRPVVPAHLRLDSPPYFIIGGLVFTPMTTAYLNAEYGTPAEEYGPVELLYLAGSSTTRPCGEQLVLLSQVLAAPLTVGYESFGNLLVVRFNGTRIRNLRHLADLVDACPDPFLTFELHPDWRLVLPAEEARQATGGILETHCIKADRSPCLKGEGQVGHCVVCGGGGWHWGSAAVQRDTSEGAQAAVDAVGTTSSGVASEGKRGDAGAAVERSDVGLGGGRRGAGASGGPRLLEESPDG